MCEKVALAVLILAATASQSFAAGAYDGIWTVSYSGVPVAYYSIHQNGDTVVAVELGSSMTWGAGMGTLNGNTALCETIIGGVQVRASVTFTSPNTLTAIQESCTPVWANYYCLLPNGATVHGVKIF